MIYASKTMSKASAFVISQRCIAESAYVEICPLPDDFYELSVKSDRKELLNEEYVLLKSGAGQSTYEVISAFDLSSALSKCKFSEDVCFIGSHVNDSFIPEGSIETIYYDSEVESGFIIRVEVDEGLCNCYKVEEWVNGDIVDQHYAIDYKCARFWISAQFTDHCSRRYSLQDLCELWNQLADVVVSEDAELTEESFLFFPAGAHVHAIWRFFEACNPLFLVGEAGRWIGPDHKYRSM
jgi:hypothetical protein